MQVLILTGPSGSGKTTLIQQLIPQLCEGGVRVSAVKHTHHDVELDRPSKDSYRLRAAGAGEVLLAARSRWTLFHELHDEPQPPLAALLARLTPVDLVLVEGFSAEDYFKLEVYRPSLGKMPFFPGDPSITGVVSDAHRPTGFDRPWLSLNNPAQVAGWVMALPKRSYQPSASP